MNISETDKNGYTLALSALDIMSAAADKLDLAAKLILANIPHNPSPVTPSAGLSTVPTPLAQRSGTAAIEFVPLNRVRAPPRTPRTPQRVLQRFRRPRHPRR